MPMELGTVAGSEQLIRDLYIDLRRKINQWAGLTKQTAQARMGYVGQHLVSVVTGLPGGRSGARGKDLVMPEGKFGEIKTCYRVDQLGRCLNCKAGVASVEEECPNCGSKDIKRNDDSKWLISMSHEEDFNSVLDPYRYFLVLFDFTDMQAPHTVRASIWDVDPLAPGFAYCMIDYYYNIKAKSTSGAPFNLWPYSLKFDIMRPSLIYRSTITQDDSISTHLFPGRDQPIRHAVQALNTYASSRNLTITRIQILGQSLGFAFSATATKRAMLDALQAYATSSGIASDQVADAIAACLYADVIQEHMPKLPDGLRQHLKEKSLLLE